MERSDAAVEMDDRRNYRFRAKIWKRKSRLRKFVFVFSLVFLWAILILKEYKPNRSIWILCASFLRQRLLLGVQLQLPIWRSDCFSRPKLKILFIYFCIARNSLFTLLRLS